MTDPDAAKSGSETIPISDPWVSRYFHSQLLEQSDGPAGSDALNLGDQEVYGESNHPILFRIGNGGAGFTGLLRDLAEWYIARNGGGFRIGWVANHSRHSQIALLADVVHVALTYEPENEELTVREGWARRVGRVFNDHFVLVGPDARLGARDIVDAFGVVAKSHAPMNGIQGRDDVHSFRFHTRGDGSATFAKEQTLWNAAGIDTAGEDWMETYPLTPYEALVKAEADGAFLLSDRATFLTAKRDGVIPSLQVHVGGGKQLLNPCSAIVKSDAFVAKGEFKAEADKAAERFATWLTGDEAQEIVRRYGRQWSLGEPLFTVAVTDEFDDQDLITLP